MALQYERSAVRMYEERGVEVSFAHILNAVSPHTARATDLR